MRKSRFSESQIVQILKSVKTGRTVKEVCREHGISDATYYNWKSKRLIWRVSSEESRKGNYFTATRAVSTAAESSDSVFGITELCRA